MLRDTAPGEPTFAALKKAFGDRYLYAGLGTTLLLGATPGPATSAAASTSKDDDAPNYAVLFEASGEHGRKLFARLERTTTTAEGVYLAQWRRSTVGCC